MFERYTEKARRTIFFARYEASQFGSPYIETEHLLLGLLREDKALTIRILPSHSSAESIRTRIEGVTTIRERVSTSVDLPLSNESKRVLAYAAEEAERLSHKHIGTEHLLLGLLQEQKCAAASILKEIGIDLGKAREIVAASDSSVVASAEVGGEIIRGRRAIIEFVYIGAVIASVSVHATSPIPRTGGQVVFKNHQGGLLQIDCPTSNFGLFYHCSIR